MREDAGLSRSEKNTSKDRNVRGVGIVNVKQTNKKTKKLLGNSWVGFMAML